MLLLKQPYTPPTIAVQPLPYTLHQGDCIAVMRTLPENSIDAIVTDPPAGIHFMNMAFDSDKGGRKQWIAWLSEVMREALRCLKPGGHAFVWALPRTSHWTATALEDAGFEIRDVITHLFGSGFPKSHNLGNGQGSALKPASEHWILCRKPLSEPTIAANVLKHGTGGLNIDASRISHNEPLKTTERTQPRFNGTDYNNGIVGPANTSTIASANPQGRFPSNLLISHTLECQRVGAKRVHGDGHKTTDPVAHNGHGFFGNDKVGSTTNRYNDSEGMETIEAWHCTELCPVRLLDEQSGVSKSTGGGGYRKSGAAPNSIYGEYGAMTYPKNVGKGDEGGASRYFATLAPTPDDYPPFYYCSKSSRKERNAGCEGLPEIASSRNGKMQGTLEHTPKYDTPERNTHPTVKPLALMRYLAAMICPENGVILDPFMGSGSTGCAAIAQGFQFVGIEQEEDYLKIAEARVAHAAMEVYA